MQRVRGGSGGQGGTPGGQLRAHWRWEKQDWWCSNFAVATTNSGQTEWHECTILSIRYKEYKYEMKRLYLGIFRNMIISGKTFERTMFLANSVAVQILRGTHRFWWFPAQLEDRSRFSDVFCTFFFVQCNFSHSLAL